MQLNGKHLNPFSCVTAFIAGKSLFLSFDCFLPSPYTTEQWLVYHWWYAYHSLISSALNIKSQIALFFSFQKL
jgi:hypothetical protein